MNALLPALLILFQEDPFKTLADPAKRAKEPERKAAIEAFRTKSKESLLHWTAAQFLEKHGAGPVPAEINAFLAQHWAAGSLDEKKHPEALDALAKAASKPEAAPIARLLALPHLAPNSGDRATRLGFVLLKDRWAAGDSATLFAIAQHFEDPLMVSTEAEAKGKGSGLFAARYAAAIVQVHRALERKTGCEAAYATLGALQGGPKRAGEHVKALAAGLRSAAYCRDCKAGKQTCETCKGKTKCDQTCPDCKGSGWMGKPGAPPDTVIRCRRCNNSGDLKNAQCLACKGTGSVTCPPCGGKPWRDGFRGCKECKTCETCKGRKETVTKCATCRGVGRVVYSTLITGGVPTLPCPDCKLAGAIKAPCAACKESGLADCAGCGGKGPRGDASCLKPSDVYTREACAACGGKGWPFPHVAVACEKCLGLGARLKPTVDPSKLLE